jgi:hypothetical protein
LTRGDAVNLLLAHFRYRQRSCARNPLNVPTPQEDEQTAKFHYAEGNKFGLEFARSLFLFNSALVVALIGFMGAKKPNPTASRWIEDAIMWFSFVWIVSILLFGIGYFINLYQANSYREPSARYWERAEKLHFYGINGLSIAVIVLLAVGFYCLFMAARTI